MKLGPIADIPLMRMMDRFTCRMDAGPGQNVLQVIMRKLSRIKAGSLSLALAMSPLQGCSPDQDRAEEDVSPQVHSSEPSMERRPIKVDDPAFASSLTLEQARALWGDESRRDGPEKEYLVYYLEGGPDYLWLWFQPDAPHELRRVLFFDGRAVAPHLRGRPFLDLMPQTSGRMAKAIPTLRPLPMRDLSEFWGPADGFAGSGFKYWVYGLADGTEAWLWLNHDDAALVGGLRIKSRDGTYKDLM